MSPLKEKYDRLTVGYVRNRLQKVLKILISRHFEPRM